MSSREEEKKSNPFVANRSVFTLYRLLYKLRAQLRLVTPKIARSSDRLLASIAYPSRFLGHVLKSPQLLKLATVLGNYRTLTRLVGTPATILSALDKLLDNKNPDKLDRIFDYVQAISDVLYQVFEDLAFLSSSGIIRISKRRTSDLWVWSSLAWLTETLVVLLRAPYYHYVLKRKVNLRSFFVNAAWFPLCYHWSTYDGVFSNDVVGLLGTMACWPTLAYQWSLPL